MADRQKQLLDELIERLKRQSEQPANTPNPVMGNDENRGSGSVRPLRKAAVTEENNNPTKEK